MYDHQLLEAAVKVQARLDAALELVSDHASIHWDGRTGHVRRICRSNKSDHMIARASNKTR